MNDNYNDRDRNDQSALQEFDEVFVESDNKSQYYEFSAQKVRIPKNRDSASEVGAKGSKRFCAFLMVAVIVSCLFCVISFLLK